MECLKSPKGFYFDAINSVYKPCYQSCASCNIDGNEQNHNCNECSDQYNFELNLNDYLNCYFKCPNYYYEEKNNNNIKYKCTKAKECPEEYNKLIPDIGKCIDKCEKENIYKYEYGNECLNDCPIGTIKNKNENDNTFYCKPICDEEAPFEIIKEQKCVKYCTIEELNKKICILNFIKANSKMYSLIKNLEMYFTSKFFDHTKIEQGEEEIYQDETFAITFTSVDNQKNNINNNMTRINLTQCEIELRKYNNISDDNILYMKKIDINITGMRIPKVLFDIYYKINETNLIQLNLSPCEKVKIEISLPIEIFEDLDKVNSSSGYFNDICYLTTSESGTDISLEDRKKDFIEGNKTICQENCVFSKYENKNAKCLCKAKGFESFIDNMKIDKNKLRDNFIDINNIMNVKILKCYKVLFNIKGIIKNIGFYIISAVIFFHIISLFVFYCCQKRLLNNKINEIIFAIRNWELVKQNRQRKIKAIKSKQILKTKNLNTIRKKEVLNKDIIDKNMKLKKQKEIKVISQINYNFRNKIINNYYSQNKKMGKTNTFMKNNSSISGVYKNSIKRTINKNINSKQQIIAKAIRIMKLHDIEMNSLSYQNALIYDKRTYCQYYISLIRTKNNLIFSFCYNNDYNSKILKIDLFFISFILFFTINALFFNDDAMHKIYEDKGSFNIIYQLPQIIYSSLISAFLNIFLNSLALSEGSILDLKKNKDKKNLNKRTSKLYSALNIKFVLYFIIGFLLLLIFWYYLAMFCAVYRNTQIHLIKDTLISFFLSFVYPFGIYLLPGWFRIPALNKSKNKKSCLYSFSKLLQIF